jgi:hypothetical protein
MNATSSPRFHAGQIVSYHGSERDCQGSRFRVVAVVAVSGAPARYSLADAAGEWILGGVRYKSVSLAANVVTRSCSECGSTHTYARNELLAGLNCAMALGPVR